MGQSGDQAPWTSNLSGGAGRWSETRRHRDPCSPAHWREAGGHPPTCGDTAWREVHGQCQGRDRRVPRAARVRSRHRLGDRLVAVATHRCRMAHPDRRWAIGRSSAVPCVRAIGGSGKGPSDCANDGALPRQSLESGFIWRQASSAVAKKPGVQRPKRKLPVLSIGRRSWPTHSKALSSPGTRLEPVLPPKPIAEATGAGMASEDAGLSSPFVVSGMTLTRRPTTAITITGRALTPSSRPACASRAKRKT